jgi:hypothetical protein
VVSSTLACTTRPPLPLYHRLNALTRRSISGERTSLPFLNSAWGSMPQTFSPTTTRMPETAAPAATSSQLTRAMSVEPRAPEMTGKSRRRPPSAPAVVEQSTAGKVATSGSAATPMAPTQVPWMLKCEKSTG